MDATFTAIAPKVEPNVEPELEPSVQHDVPSKLDLNSATLEQLQALPHIAEHSARLIITHRPYATVAEVPSKANLTGRAKHKWDDVAALVDVRPIEA